MRDIVYLNGKYLPRNQAAVSVMDRGFLFGDGVYEVIPAYNRKLFRLQQHLERLDNSLIAIRVDPELTHSDWRALLEQLIAKQSYQHLSVYLQITRGAADKRDHLFALENGASLQPTIFAMCDPLSPEIAELTPIRAITLPDIRWQNCHIKATSLLANVLMKQQAFDAGAGEGLLLHDGHINEGTASNVFAVIDGQIITPAKSHAILPGITRDLLLELAIAHKMPALEAPIPVDKLDQISELWVTSSTREIRPITELDGQPVGDGKIGFVTRRMHQLFAEYKAALVNGEE